MPRFSLDSNILFYAVDRRDPMRNASALAILARAAQRDRVLVPQALAEFFSATTRKGIMPRSDAMAQVQDWLEIFAIALGPTMLAAGAANTPGRFQFYDALLLATAAAAGCSALISEDMGDATELNGVRIVAAFDAAGGISPAALALLGG